VPGTPAHRKCAEYFVKQLKSTADRVDEQKFLADVGGRTIEMNNIIAVFSPPTGSDSWALICAHWDSRPTADREDLPARRAQAIAGANDGASGAAVILELARALSVQRAPRGVILVLLDGEDYGPDVAHMFYGSRYFAQAYRGTKPTWGVLLDMIGDRDLRIPIEGNSQLLAPEVVSRIYGVAERLKVSAFVREPGSYVTDDHLQLNGAGIPCIDLIDFQYPYWHTLADTPDKCSAESLQAVGDVLLTALREP
jgi:Zn-dependent M28 family amino/carboxypeptidase